MAGSSVCPNCNKTAQTDLQKSVPCDGCHNFVHLACVHLTADDVSKFTRLQTKAVKIYCKNCCAEVDTISSLKKLILTLQADLLELKNNLSSKPPTADIYPDMESIISEINDRNRRESNIIISGIPEAVDFNDKVSQIITKVAPSVPIDDIKVHRIGSPQNSPNARPRLVKVKLSNPETARTVLRSAAKIRSFPDFRNIYVNPDRTHMQMQYFKKIKAELDSRKANGENNIRISYVNGIPKVTQLKN